MKENPILDKDKNLPNPKQTSLITSIDNNFPTNHTFKTIKKRIPWTEAEDKTIKSLVNKYGTSNWTLISNQMGQNRTGKQCRERWYNQLNPNKKKNNWTNEEENILFIKHMNLGNKWSDIASFLPGRTLNDIKNHFYSKLRKFIRKILKQINDENLFKINGIDACKYTGEKIYKLIKQYKINYKNLTKDTIFEMIIASEKAPTGKIIFFSDNSNNMEYNLSNSNFINNLGINYIDFNDENGKEENNTFNKNFFNNNLFFNLHNYQKINQEFDKINKEDSNVIINNKNNSKKKKYILKNNDKTKLKKSELNINEKNLNIKEVINNHIIKNETKDKNINKDNINKKNNNKLIGQKRKKNSGQKKNNINKSSSQKKNKNKIKYILEVNKNSKKHKSNQENICHNLLLIKNNLKEKNNKRTINNKINNSDNDNLTCCHNDNINQKNKKEVKFNPTKEKSEKNNYCFYPPFKTSTPKTTKNIIFPSSETKSNKSLKPEDFSFNKLNFLNDYLDSSSQMQQIFPVNIENILLGPQKNKNIFIPDLSLENNILKSRGSCLGSVKNDNTYKNFSIDGNLYNKIINQNNNFNNNMTIKSIDDNGILDGKNDITINKKIEKPNINLDLINRQDFTNTIINGNIVGGNESQYNSIFNKNNALNMYNSSPSSMKSFWK